jgi:hypothetical protein
MSYTTLATLDVERLSEPRLMLPPDLRYSEWSALGERIGALVRFSSWALGDWLLYGDDHFGELVSQAETMTGLDYATLANARRTCRAFPPHRRHALLSFPRSRLSLPTRCSTTPILTRRSTSSRVSRCVNCATRFGSDRSSLMSTIPHVSSFTATVTI